MNKIELLRELNRLAMKTNSNWMESLSERKIRELEFHNQFRDKNLRKNISQDTFDKLYGNEKYYKTIKLSTEYIENWIKENANGKIFLDYASGNGAHTIRAARSGAELAIGLDLSNISIQNARKLAEIEGVSNNSYFIQGDCENTGLPNECIDTCLCSGMLHHLDLSCAFYELRRILKPGGIILAMEALEYNPLIKLYRNLTPQMRTEWEKSHIIGFKDIEFAKNYFNVKEIKHWHLFSIAGAYFPFALNLLNNIDDIILRNKFINRMSWMFSFELHKE
jgi:SAM-dependent methyltransferase